MFLGHLHRFDHHLRSAVAKCRINATGVKPAHAVLAKNLFPVDIALLDLAGGRIAAIRHTFGAPNTKAALGKIKAIAHRATDTIIIAPLDVIHIHAALHDKILHQPTDLIIGESGDNARLQTETTPKTTRHVIFAAAFPHIEIPSRAHTAIAGIKAQHDFPQRNHVVPALVGGLNFKNGHRPRRL